MTALTVWLANILIMELFSLLRLGVCVLNKVTLQPSDYNNAADHEAMSLLKRVCLQTVTVTGNLGH